MSQSTPNLDRHGLEVLGADECLQLLGSQPVGRLAFLHEGGPMILPVNFVPSHGGVAFRTADGSKLDVAIMGRPVAFEVDGFDAEGRTGWSVVVQGVAELVEDEERVAELERRDLHTWSAHAVEGSWTHVRAEEISGRRVTATG